MNFRQIRGWLMRLCGLFNRQRREREFAEELESHLALHIADNLRAGMSPEDARRQAQIKLGGVTQAQELHREQRGLPMLETLFQDLRFGLRMLRKNPGFSLIAILTLALGIGANTAIFSVVNAALLRPLPYREPQALLTVWESHPARNLLHLPVSVPNYQDWREQNQVFSELAAFSDVEIDIAAAEGVERIYTGLATADLFPLLGVQPALGRSFTAEEEARGEPLMLLSHGLWQRRFGGNPQVIGTEVTGNNQRFTVIGVLPADFPLAYDKEVPQAWVLLNPHARMSGVPLHQRGSRLNRVVGRLKPGVTLAQANEAMNAVARRLGEQYPETNAGYGVTITPFHEHLVGKTRRPLLLLLGAVGFVLLVACANVANLLLARASTRRREMAIRAALGAGRARVMRQLLTESVLLALLGGALGTLIGFWGTQTLIALAPAEIPRLAAVTLDGRVLSFTLLLSLLTGVVFGLAPAWQVSKLDLRHALNEGGRSGGFTRNRTRSFLVVAEVALSLVLLIGAGLLVRSFAALLAVNPGFDPRHTLTLYVGLPESRYAERTQQAAFYQQLLERVEGLPGVESAGVIFPMVLKDRVSNRFTIEGRAPAAPTERLSAFYRSISPDYFRAMGIRLLQGRAFTASDNAQSAPVVIINETMARLYWPNRSPVGQRMTINVRFHTGQDTPREIVGVVADVKHAGLAAASGPEMYTSHQQVPWPWMVLVVRTASAPTSVAAAVTSEVRALDKNVPLPAPVTLEQRLADSMATQRFNMWLLSLFAALALALAASGIYSVMAYSVTQRKQEIGIRLALGAQPRDVLKLIVKQGMKLAALGIGVGLLAAFAVTRLLTTLLFGVSATDPLTLSLVTLLLALVVLLACWVPARRATKVDPLVALRTE